MKITYLLFTLPTLSINLISNIVLAAPIELSSPISCQLGQDCFIQQLTDLDISKKTSDPFCGSASYDGHKGTDFRLRTLTDINKDVEILAAADGVVKGIRNNMPDRLINNKQDIILVKDKECGNGISLDHGNGIDTQYCHMKYKSIQVEVGEKVKRGDVLGYVGASGLTQFAHLHFSLRNKGEVIDPFTGASPAQGCGLGKLDTWWQKDSPINFAQHDAILLDIGFSGKAINHRELNTKRPSSLSKLDSAAIGWVWYANLKKDDQIFIELKGPNNLSVKKTTNPLERAKATWSGFIGKKLKPVAGEYIIMTHIQRAGKSTYKKSKTLLIK